NLCLAQSANLKVDITVTDDISGFRANTPTDIQYKWVQKGTDPASVSWKSPTTPISIINNQKTVSFSETNSVDKGIYILHVKAIDYAGNEFTKVSGEYNLCNYSVLPPALSAAPSTGWVKDKVVVTITPKDAEETVYYSLDENAPKDTWTKYTSPIDITENKTVWAYAKSAANIDSAASSISITNIDKTVPTVSIDTDNAVPYKSIEASITATDLGGSNVKEINYAWVETSITNVPENGWTALSPIGNILPAYGVDISSAKRLFVKVIDNAGNEYVTYKDYTLDNTAPVVNITTDNTKPLKSVTVQTTATDANEVAKKEYIWTDELATKPTTGYTAYTTDTLPIYAPGTTGNKKVWIKVTDKAGNVAEASKVFKIDNTAPTVSITTAKDVPYKVVAPRFTKTDNLSIATNIEIYYQWAEENAPQPTQNYILLTLDNIPDYNNANTSGKKTLWIQAIDEANNISYVNKTFTIDNTNPVITVSSKDLKTNKITVHASVTDNVDTVTNTNLKLRYKKNVEATYTEINAD
ncbi:MAG: chitobiase/beta-hexosaminidase C-terminal domain-containing protein, partial [Clostridia bacterium]